MGRGLCKPTLETMHGGTCLLYMAYKPISLPPEDSQFLATREFGVEEICRIFRVPPHLVQDLKRSTFNNIENQGISYVQYTLMPWLERFEQAIIKDLLVGDEQDEYFPKFNVDGLLRGDYKSRMEGYAIGRNNGWMSANDIRELENLDPLPEGEGGDDYIVNGTFIKLKDVGRQYGVTQGEDTSDPAQPEEQETEEQETEKQPEEGQDGKEEQHENKRHTERHEGRRKQRR